MGFKLNCFFCFLNSLYIFKCSHYRHLGELDGDTKNREKQEKQQLQSVIGDVAPVEAELGPVRGGHHLQDASCLVWPSSAQESWSSHSRQLLQHARRVFLCSVVEILNDLWILTKGRRVCGER